MKYRSKGRFAAAACITAAAVAAAGMTVPAQAANETINVLMVGNPQMNDIKDLTDANFTAKTGIKVNFTILPENELRDKVTQDVATGAGQYDVVTIGMYEVPIWGAKNWLQPLDAKVNADAAYDAADILPAMKKGLSQGGKLYALPFYGESSMLMYRKDLANKAGVTIPLHPTWDQVAAAAAKMNDKKNGVAGICLRGLPGWGEVFAPLTTVVNTYGGTWFDQSWNAKVNAKPFVDAVTFYVNLIKNYGEAGAAQSGFTECDNAMAQGKAAMWYDATSATSSIESTSFSKFAGKFGYAFAPTKKTANAGWLWAWAFAIEGASKKADAAYKFMSWATSKDYEQLVGNKLGWTRVPDGKRASTYAIPKYQEASKAYYKIVLDSIKGVDPTNPTKPLNIQRPKGVVGVQFLAIPEFADLGTKVAQEVSAAIAGKQSVKAALDKGQKYAQAVGRTYKG